MSIKNKTRYAILGVLSISPCTGYDIKKYCDNIISNFWNENYGHIYPVLKTLLEDEVIERIDEETTDRKKKYMITNKGREEFFNWLMEPTIYQPARSEFLLKLSFSNILKKEDIIKMIHNYRQDHMKKLDEYKEMEKYLESEENIIKTNQRFYVLAPLRYGILSTEAVITWCNEVIREIEKLDVLTLRKKV